MTRPFLFSGGRPAGLCLLSSPPCKCGPRPRGAAVELPGAGRGLCAGVAAAPGSHRVSGPRAAVRRLHVAPCSAAARRRGVPRSQLAAEVKWQAVTAPPGA